MLVKIDDVWVDPTKVVSVGEGAVTLVTGTVLYVTNASDNSDAYAGIINAALETQSFGGEPDASVTEEN